MDSSAFGSSGASAPAVSGGAVPILPGQAERDRRLSRRVLGGAIIVALAIVSLTGLMLWRLQRAQLDEGLNDVSSLDLLVAAQTERAFESVGVVLDDISADIQAQGIASAAALREATGNEATFRLLRAKMAGIAQLDALAIATSDGNVVNRTRSYPVASQTNVADREYFTRLRDHPELEAYISPPLPGADGKPMVYIGKRLNAPNGAFIGIVLGAVRATYFADLYTNYLRALPGGGKSMALWRNDGTLLSRSPTETDATVDATPPDLARPMAGDGPLTYWTADPHGSTVAIAQRRLDNLPLTVEVRQSASAVLAPWNGEFLATSFSGGALLLLVGAAVWLLMRQLRTQALIIEERARANREAEAREDIERARMKAEAAMRDMQQSEARFRDIAEVGSDWIWETDAAHRFTMVAGARQPKVSLLGKTRWEQASGDPETDPLWREHKAVLDAHQPFRQFRVALQLPGGRFHVCVSGKPIFADDGSFVGYRGTVSDETELVETRERAMRADTLLRNAIESIAEGFVIYDAEDRFVMCNEAYRKMYGENAAGFVPGTRYEAIMRQALATGRHLDAIGREDEWLAERMRKHLEATESEESRLADGRWVMRSERRMADGGIAGLRIDITALKQAQEALRENQVMLNRAQRLSGTGSVVRNLVTKETEWSDEMYRIFGVERGSFEARTENFLTLIHPEDRARVEALITQGSSIQAEPPTEFRIVRPDGTMRWVYREADFWCDSNASLGVRLTTYKDITEKREADMRQRELEALLRDAIESISEGFVIYDANDRLIICNEGYRRLYPEVADLIVPGVHFADILRAQLTRGEWPERKGREEEWIAQLLRERRLFKEPSETQMPDGRWILVAERPMSNGGLAGLRVDITALKKAQHSLIERQAMLNRAQRLSATGSAIRDLKTNTVEWSDEMNRIFGIEPGTIAPGPALFRSYIHPEDRDRVPSAREIAIDSEKVPAVHFRIVRPDGTLRWVHREVELVRGAGGEVTGILSTYKDITEKHEADIRQRELEALLRDAIESISEGFVIYDAEDRIVLCNEAFRKLYPSSMDKLVPGTRYEDILRGAAYENRNMPREAAEEWITQRLRQHRELKEPVELQLEDGRWLFISERRTSSGGTAGLRVDITPLKRVQQSLHDSRQRLDRTQSIAHLGTAERNLRTGAVVWSDETYRIFGVDPTSYTPSAENLLGVVYPEDRPLVLEVLRRGHQEHVNSGLQFRIVRPSGELRTIQSQADVAYDEAGQPLYISIAMLDITEKEQARQRQLELETQLRHSEKLTALGTLAGGIAHDLNNTLVPIQALSKLAMQEFPPDTPVRGDLETIYQASIQARDLVRQILTFSRKHEVLNEPTDIAARVREALHMMHASVPSTIEIVERIAPIESILGDGTQLQQVLVNLVANGAHAIGDNCGRVTVTLDEVPGEPGAPRLVRLSVADTGCGMSPEIIHRMFEPFFTTKSVGEGTGLGLSVVHGIVTSHGGTIDVRSTPGQGTEFIILLPARSVDETSAIAAVA